MNIKQKKQLLREAAQERRMAYSINSTEFVVKILGVFKQFFTIPTTKILGGYSALTYEADPALILSSHMANGGISGLPSTQRTLDTGLVFRQWSLGDELAYGTYGVLEPLPSQPVIDPDIVLVPLVAFDDRGCRLGYGGGYYDRALANLRSRKSIQAIGIAYSFQEMEEIPAEEHDQFLDYIATEKEIRRFPGKGKK